MRKTLLAVGSALIVSMLLAPHGSKPSGLRGWGPFFSDHGFSAQNFAYCEIGRVMIDMLILQTVFLAVLCAVVVNIRWRSLRRLLTWFAVCVALLLMFCVGFPAFQRQMKAGAESEEWMARGDIDDRKFDSARDHLLKAANYCWWQGWWDGARNARQRASDVQGMERQAAAFHAQKDEERVMQLLGMTNPFDQFHLPPFYQSEEKVKEAKQLLLDAAANWRGAANSYEEQRVMEWEKKIKTKAEFLASLPDQPAPSQFDPDEYLKSKGDIFDDLIPPKKNITSGPNAGTEEAKTAEEQWRARVDSEAEEAQCRAPLNYPPVKWDHRTELGKTFAIIKFRERKSGDRKQELDGYAKAIGARFYKQWSRVRKGGADFVEVVFYK